MNMLPELPKKLNKREANWTTNVLHKWWMGNKPPAGPIEVKYAQLDYLNFKLVTQLPELLACMSDKGHWWKVADMGRKNSFDVVWYCKSPAWIVIKYPKGFVAISASAFDWEMKNSKRKSLTWQRAKEIATYTK